MAVFLAASAFLYGGGHAQASPSGEGYHHLTWHVMDHAQPCADVRHGYHGQSDHQGSDDAGCRLSGLGCAICALLPSVELVAAPKGGAFGKTLFPASATGEAQLQLRPPKLAVAA